MATKRSAETSKVVLLVGLTGSGKSTFAETFIKLMEADGDKTWHRVSQDVLKSVGKCKAAAIEALEKGENIIIDRTNLSADQVQFFIFSVFLTS